MSDGGVEAARHVRAASDQASWTFACAKGILVPRETRAHIAATMHVSDWRAGSRDTTVSGSGTGRAGTERPPGPYAGGGSVSPDPVGDALRTSIGSATSRSSASGTSHRKLSITFVGSACTGARNTR